MNKTFLDDRDMVECCIKKDLAAWARLIKKYSGLISISIENSLNRYGFKPSPQDAEDIRQEVLASIWKEEKLKTVRNREDISYWLAIVSGNEALAYMRRRRTETPAKTISLFDKVNEKEVAELLPSSLMNPDDVLFKEEITKKFKAALETLPSKERLIIKLNLIHNKKYHEIAKLLNVPEGTVSSYIKRAKVKLKGALKDFT